MFWNQTFDKDVDCNPDEVRALFVNDSDLHEGQIISASETTAIHHAIFISDNKT